MLCLFCQFQNLMCLKSLNVASVVKCEWFGHARESAIIFNLFHLSTTAFRISTTYPVSFRHVINADNTKTAIYQNFNSTGRTMWMF